MKRLVLAALTASVLALFGEQQARSVRLLRAAGHVALLLSADQSVPEPPPRRHRRGRYQLLHADRAAVSDGQLADAAPGTDQPAEHPAATAVGAGRSVRPGVRRHGLRWRGLRRRGLRRSGAAWLGLRRRGLRRRGAAWLGPLRSGPLRPGAARLGAAHGRPDDGRFDDGRSDVGPGGLTTGHPVRFGTTGFYYNSQPVRGLTTVPR